MRQQNKKTPLVFRIGLVLLGTIICSIHMMGGLYARYSTSSGKASDNARVAIFSFEDDLSEQAQSIPVYLSPGEYISTTITIKNNGEVTLRYVVTIKNLTKNLPIEDQTIISDEITSDSESTFTWKIEWPQSKNSVVYVGKMDVLRVVVTVEQVD